MLSASLNKTFLSLSDGYMTSDIIIIKIHSDNQRQNSSASSWATLFLISKAVVRFCCLLLFFKFIFCLFVCWCGCLFCAASSNNNFNDAFNTFLPMVIFASKILNFYSL